MDVTGKILVQDTFEKPNYSLELDFSALPNGLYFLQIFVNNEQKTMRFIKQN